MKVTTKRPRPKNTMILRRRRAQVILQHVARRYGFTLEAMCSPDRDKRLVAARCEFYRLCKDEGIGSTTIGKTINRNQDTVRYHLIPSKQESRQNRYLRNKEKTHEPARTPYHRAPAAGGEPASESLG